MKKRTLKDKGYAGWLVHVEVEGKCEFLSIGNKIMEFEKGTAEYLARYLTKKLGLKAGYGVIHKKGMKLKDVENAINTDNDLEKRKIKLNKLMAEVRQEAEVLKSRVVKGS